MIKRIDNKTVFGPGYEIEVVDIHTVIYSEDILRISVEIEGGSSDGIYVNWLVYTESLDNTERGINHRILKKNEKEEILKRISNALNMLGMPHKLV